MKKSLTRFSIAIFAAMVMMTLGLGEAFVPEAQAGPGKSDKARKDKKPKKDKANRGKAKKEEKARGAKGHDKARGHGRPDKARGPEARPDKPGKNKERPERGERERGPKKAKVTVCHVPPGNPGKGRVISVGAPALRAHLKRGSCETEAAIGERCSCGEAPERDEEEEVEEEGEEIEEEDDEAEEEEAKELFRERRKHLSRLARLARLESLATEGDDARFLKRIRALRLTEQARYKKALGRLKPRKSSR